MTLGPISHSDRFIDKSHNDRKVLSRQDKELKDKEIISKTQKISNAANLNSIEEPSHSNLFPADLSDLDERLAQRERYIKLFIETDGMSREDAEAFVDAHY